MVGEEHPTNPKKGLASIHRVTKPMEWAVKSMAIPVDTGKPWHL